MKRFFFVLLCFSLSVISFSQNEDSVFIKRISDYILTQGRSYEDLRILTKQVGARLSGSKGMYKAEQWGLKTIREAGADNAMLQECMVPHWDRGGKDEAFVVPNPKGQAKKRVL